MDNDDFPIYQLAGDFLIFLHIYLYICEREIRKKSKNELKSLETYTVWFRSPHPHSSPPSPLNNL